MKKLNIYSAACLLTFPILSFAAGSNMPQSGAFVGLGGSYNSVNFSQDLNLVGTADVYNNAGSLVAYGDAGGPANPFNNNQSSFAPQAQLGYFKHFANSDNLWGVKLFYQYLGITSTDDNIVAPQIGTLSTTSAAPESTSFLGRAVIGSAQTKINHEVALMPFFGHSFKNSYVYFGAGPSLFGTKTNLYNVTGYADINGNHIDVTGNPANFSSSKWMWGGAAEVGVNYYLDPTWSVDANYTYAMTARYTTNYFGTYSNSATYSANGNLYGSASQRVRVQGVTLAIQKAFSF